MSKRPFGTHGPYSIDHFRFIDSFTSHQEDEETIEISFPEQVSPNGEGALKITLEYLGKFRKDLTGLYQSTYETDEGVEQKLIATALEPTYAREVKSLAQAQDRVASMVTFLTYNRFSHALMSPL
jgi:aminopeptidase N